MLQPKHVYARFNIIRPTAASQKKEKECRYNNRRDYFLSLLGKHYAWLRKLSKLPFFLSFRFSMKLRLKC